jgi:hypothetical protein
MPIEIKELHIRVAVNAPPNRRATEARGGAGGGGGVDGNDDGGRDIVAECVEQVLAILDSKKER